MRKLFGQFTRFGLVGAIGLVIDTGIFNLLRLTILSPDELHEGPVIAKVISTTVAIATNWIGNRLWTFREHRGRQLVREGVEFALVSVGGMLIGLACLWVSHYALGFTSLLADNIASNVVGLGLGTAFRFALYRAWVFAPHRGDTAPALFPDDTESTASGPRETVLGAAEPLERPTRRAPRHGIEAVAGVDHVGPRDA
ncbi:GtrA family protein [uncultured Schumannella sp.]|uniref:GtrA family protein n=1 Tax=uncultured Schumannella sp. TaxID=1195956 RepID=UPI0025CB8C1A|nr:GtrA family protein [uncultured Schumannella sp.]